VPTERTRATGTSPAAYATRYAPDRVIPSRELRDLLGARVHFGADVAVFVTTTRFSRGSEKFVVQNDILGVHRDHFGMWNNGTPRLGRAEGRPYFVEAILHVTMVGTDRVVG